MGALRVLDKKPQILLSLEDGEQESIFFEDIFCQTMRPDAIAFEARVYVALAWQRVLRGDYVYRALQVRQPPGADRDVELNRSILDEAVEIYRDEPDVQLVAARYYGGYAEDGWIEFAEPFIACGGDASRAKARACRFPLEVGYCMPDQMFFHIAQSGRVARFPYGCRYILCFENLLDGW